MAQTDLVVRSTRVLTAEGLRPAALHVADGRIARVTDPSQVRGPALLDVGDAVVLPGLVDTHVHVNEPGRTDWEGFETATRAAAAGGITTLLDMPLNSIPPTTTVPALEEKRAAARGHCWVDVGFWGGAVPGNAADLAELSAAGVFGFKAFLVPSGVEEFGWLDGDGLCEAATAVAAVDGLLLVHAEAPEPIRRAESGLDDDRADWRRYETYLRSRPPEAEVAAVEAVLAVARRTGCRVHVLHLSAAAALAPLRAARDDGLAVTVETCPHYLTLAAEDVPDGATDHKCAPPIRSQDNRALLWEALEAGDIDLVVSDHSPCPPALKEPEAGDFRRAWGGIASLQLGAALIWTAASGRGLGLPALAAWMSERPARLAGLTGKGALAPGNDADFVVFSPDETAVVDPCALQHRHPTTPYAGRRLRGRVEATYLRGVPVFRDGAPVEVPMGRLLRRAAA